jgi:HlyD family type I secretion membrane fusion protein
MVSSQMMANHANTTSLPTRAAKVGIVALAPRRAEVLPTRELLQMLSNMKLPAHVLPSLQHDVPLKNQGEGIVLREATSITATIRTRTGALAASGSPSLEMPLDAPTQAQRQSEWQDVQAKLAKLDFEAARCQAEIDTVKQTIAKPARLFHRGSACRAWDAASAESLCRVSIGIPSKRQWFVDKGMQNDAPGEIGGAVATVPMAQTREAHFKRLVGEGFISSHPTQDKTRERVELERDLTVQRARLLEAQSALNETQQTKASYKSETLRTLSDRHAQATTKYSQLQSDATKATQRERKTQLTAPVAGIIQQLAIHSIGGVVTSAQPLMIVVPDSPTVTAEITIANQDIGFVYAGQMAKVKLETFPYTKYGTVGAKVDVVTADAVTDEKKGSYYPATLTLSQKDMLTDGKRVNLSPGMNITAEIKTGQRRIIEFLLSPVQRAGSESLRER